MKELRVYGIEPLIAAPEADAAEAEALYGVRFTDMDDIRDRGAVILAVAHAAFGGMDMARVSVFFGAGRKALLDVKGVLERKAYEGAEYIYWRL